MIVDLGGLRTLVSGSSRGIGRVIAAKLASCGAIVGINGRSPEAVAVAVAELERTAPGTYFAAPGDLTTAAGAEAVIAASGDLDILVANAGIYEKLDLFEITDEQWLQAFNDNVLSGVRLARHYAPRMKAKGWGRILFIGSNVGIVPSVDLPAYSAAKAAQASVARSFAEALKFSGVTVNTLVVGPTAVPDRKDERTAVAKAEGLTLDEHYTKRLIEGFPTSVIGRYVEAAELAELAAFVVSREASATTGAAWRAEGGILQHIG